MREFILEALERNKQGEYVYKRFNSQIDINTIDEKLILTYKGEPFSFKLEGLEIEKVLDLYNNKEKYLRERLMDRELITIYLNQKSKYLYFKTEI